jgi:hypothetical protein
MPLRDVAVGVVARAIDVERLPVTAEPTDLGNLRVRHAGEFPDHLNRVMASDLRYPIHLVECEQSCCPGKTSRLRPIGAGLGRWRPSWRAGMQRGLPGRSHHGQVI